ncbi:MAG TPA: tetratricopeptide repeat protein, partial [Polyangiaceae bacterium]|nr:tetratricopeptide repeat protein [Polyangiaceae bacterium]
ETALAALSEADRTLHAWADTGETFDARLEITGPARCLRAIAASPHPIRVTVNNPRITVSIDISDGLVVGATADSRTGPEQHWEGAVALSAFMVLSSGRIHITPVNQPAQTNVMATIDVALNMADSEPSPIAPSIPSAAASSLRPPPGELPISTSLRPNAGTSLPAAEPHGLPGLGRVRTGISTPAAIFLVALAALQGLLIVAGLSAILKSHRAKAAARASSEVVASAAAPVSASQSSSLPAPREPPPSAPTSAPVEAASSAAPVTAGNKDIPLDETGVRAPSCEELFGVAHVAPGDYPGSAFVEMRSANQALVRGDVDSAERSLCKAALWDQKNPAIVLELAQLMLLRRDGAASVEWAKKGLEQDPSSLRAQGILGDGLARVGDYTGAKHAWLLSMRLEGASDAQYRDLSFSSLREARASMNRRDFARAERFFRRAVVLDADNGPACNGLADALLRLGDADSALRWANRAISVAPRDPAARVILGDVLFQKGDRGGAEVEWREALQLDPANFLGRRRMSKLATLAKTQ